jgi:threonine dehydratase
MFHYRNQGADYSRVLVGLQVPHGERRAFAVFLDEIGYRHWDETSNPAYRLFLA